MALETNEWLVWLGIRDPAANISGIQEDIERLQETIGDFEQFQEDITSSAITSFSDIETYLQNNGWSADEAQDFVTNIENNFSTFQDFETFVDNSSSYQDLTQQFNNTAVFSGTSQTANGVPAAGVRVHDQAGSTFDNVQVPAGTVEVFGQEVHISEQNAPSTQSNVNYSNLDVRDSDNVVDIGESLDIAADVENTNSTSVDVEVPYLEDGSVEDRKTVNIPANTTETVVFTVTHNSYICVDASIGDLPSVTVCWTASSVN